MDYHKNGRVILRSIKLGVDLVLGTGIFLQRNSKFKRENWFGDISDAQRLEGLVGYRHGNCSQYNTHACLGNFVSVQLLQGLQTLRGGLDTTPPSTIKETLVLIYLPFHQT